MNATFYTYFHTRNDTGKPFYVGKGKGKRAHTAKGRNQHWCRIALRYGYSVHLARTAMTECEAFDHEKFLILCFKDCGIELANATGGGEGRSGWIPDGDFREMVSRTHKGKVIPAEVRAKMGVAIRKGSAAPEAKEKRRAAWGGLERRAAASIRGKATIRNAIAANIGKPSGMLGKKHSAEAKARISAASIGANNAMHGKTFSHTAEAKAKIAAASRRRLITLQARSNISAAAKSAWARRKANAEYDRNNRA